MYYNGNNPLVNGVYCCLYLRTNKIRVWLILKGSLINADSQHHFLRRDLRQLQLETVCPELSRTVASHLSQNLKKVQLLRHVMFDMRKWSTVSTLGAHAVHVHSTTTRVFAVHELWPVVPVRKMRTHSDLPYISSYFGRI